jgi:hypothetical protein
MAERGLAYLPVVGSAASKLERMRAIPAIWKGYSMARTKKGTPPSYPKKPHKGQARITVPLATGKRHEIYLGAFGSEASRQEYRRVLAVLEANGYFPVKEGAAGGDLTLNELALRFWKHAQGYYRLADGSPSRELEHFESSLRPALDLYGNKLAADFGPLALKAVRQRLVDAKRYRVRVTGEDGLRDRWVTESRIRLDEGREGRGWAEWNGQWRPVEVLKAEPALSRKVINQRVDHIKRVFRWAVSEELVPPSVHDALRSVPGLRRGHKGTYDHPKVRPVPDEHVEVTLRFLRPQVAAMVQLQRLVGTRETEVCLMRGQASPTGTPTS